MKEACIYKIENKIAGKLYIGSSLSLKNRWERHRRDLNSGIHHSIHLQRAWDKYGDYIRHKDKTILESYMKESDIMRLILIGLCAKYKNGLFYRRNVGVMKTKDGFVKFGLPGMGDISGIINGMAIEIEVKSEKGKQSEQQKNWQIAVERAGGIYILTNSVEDCISKVELSIKRG